MSLPFSDGQTNQFFKCLHHIDREAALLGIDNYGIYDTTLEEVGITVIISLSVLVVT